MDRTVHIFLLEGPYMGHTVHNVLVRSLMQNPYLIFPTPNHYCLLTFFTTPPLSADLKDSRIKATWSAVHRRKDSTPEGLLLSAASAAIFCAYPA